MLCGRFSGLVGVVLGAAFAATSAHALSFTCITGSPGDPECLIGETQFSATISDAGNDQVLITFSNSGPDPSIIADVYIDDGAGAFASIDSIVNGTGVQFSVDATPPDLPGGNLINPPFVATTGLTADADPPTGTGGNGADPGESFSLLMNLAQGFTFSDLQALFDDGTIRLGIHGQGLGATGGSQSFVSGPPPSVVPEPTAALLFGAGALLVARRKRRS